MLFICPEIIFSQTQIDCGALRYDQEIFPAVDATNDVTYGANINSGGTNEVLTMDIYQPVGDTVLFRPLIVWVHGGSFLSGTKNDVDVVALANHFAKRGYVCASINYRLGIPFPMNEESATKAVYRATQDMKAAIRYFRKDATTTNDYKIDPELIFGGGSSAGAFTALHLAYLNEISEIPAVIDTTLMGNIEGESGNPGYSSTVNAVINLCGALGHKTYMVPGDVPLVSMHGTDDQTVPYATDTIVLLGLFPIMEVDGSFSIHQYANTIAVVNEMYTYYGSGHVPFVSSAAYMDTTVRFVSNFLYNYLSCTPRDPNPLPNTFGTTDIAVRGNFNNAIKVYPNPANEFVVVESEFSLVNFQLFDISGRLVRSENGFQDKRIVIRQDGLSAGIYVVALITEQGEVRKRICFGY